MASFPDQVMQDAVAAGLHVYVIADGARKEMLGAMIEARSGQTQALAPSGRNGPLLAAVGPKESMLRWLFTEGTNKRWFITLLSRHATAALATHAKRFIRVGLSDGRTVTLRYYDPMILLSQIPAFSIDQRRLFFSKFDTVYADLDGYLFRLRCEPDGRIAWTMFSDGKPLEGATDGFLSPPALDLTGSAAQPRFALSKQQYEAPVLTNMPLLVEQLDATLREDFGRRMRAYPPGIVRAMIEAGALTAMHDYRIDDLECVHTFVDLQWRVAPGFHRQPEVHAILTDFRRTPAQRIDRLAANESNEPLAQAFAYDDTGYWNLPISTTAL